MDRTKIKKNSSALIAWLLVLALLLSGCGHALPEERETELVQTAPVPEQTSLEEEVHQEETLQEEVHPIEAAAPDMKLETSLWDVPVGEQATVVFTLKGAESTDAPMLYADEDQIAVFESAEDGIWLCSTVLYSEERAQRRFHAQCSDQTSNALMISFYLAPTEEEEAASSVFIDQLQAVYDANAERLDPTAEELDAALQAVSEALDDAVASGILRQYAFFNNGVMLEFPGGLRKIAPLFVQEGCWGGGTDELIRSLVEQTAEESGQVQTPVGRRVGVFQPFYGTKKTLDFAVAKVEVTEHSCDVFKKAGQAVAKNYQNFSCDWITNVTMSDLMNLDKYDVLIWEGHSIAIKNWKLLFIEAYMQKSEIQAFKAAYPEDFGSRIFVNNAGDCVFFSSDFIDKYYPDGSMDGMLIWLGVCYGTYLEYQWKLNSEDAGRNIFTDKGAALVITSNGEITDTYLDKMTEAFFEQLSQGRSALASLQEAQRRHGKYKSEKDSWLKKLRVDYEEDKTELVIIDNSSDSISADTYTLPKDLKPDRQLHLTEQEMDEYDLTKMTWTWTKMNEYPWDDMYYYPGQFSGTFVETALGDRTYLFIYPGDPVASDATPLEMTIYTKAGYIMGYDDVCLFGGIHNGITLGRLMVEENEALLKLRNSRTALDKIRFYNLSGRGTGYVDFIRWEISDANGNCFTVEFGFLDGSDVINQFHVIKDE